jgi:hypothetical protein
MREDATEVPEAENLYNGGGLNTVRATVRDVKLKIRKLRKEAAAGPDGIGPVVLQECVDQVAPALAMIYNRSLESGDVLESGKRDPNL